MADLASTRVFGKLTVMHDAIVKANAEMLGNLSITKNTPEIILKTPDNEEGSGGVIRFEDHNSSQGVQLKYGWHNSNMNPYGLRLEESPNNPQGHGASLWITGVYHGDGSGLTGTASLRATGTTKGDVGLGSVDNYSRAHYDGRYLAAGGKAVNSDKLDGLHASQFLRSDAGGSIDGPLTIKHTNVQLNLEDTSYGGNFWQLDHQSGNLNFRYNGNATSLVIKENGEISGNGGGLTGTASLRAKGTTKSDVGLGSVRNVSSYSQREIDSSISTGRYDLASASTTATLDLSSQQVFTVNASSNRTLSFSNAPGSNRAMTVVVRLSGSAGAITWPSGINWSGGSAPELKTTWTVVTLFWDGSNWSGFGSGGAD